MEAGDGEDPLPAREGRRGEPVPRTRGDRAVLGRHRRRRARDRPRQEERDRLDPDQGRRARPRRVRGEPRRAARRGQAPRHREARARHGRRAARARGGGGATYDVVIVGSGINSLAAAALLARGGKRVLVLERNDWLGGAIRTAEVTEPGFVHELFASWHPLWVGSAAYAELKDELDARGLEYLNTDLPTATLFPDGSSAFLTTSHDANVAHLDELAPGDGAGWDRAVGEFMPNADLAFGMLTA